MPLSLERSQGFIFAARHVDHSKENDTAAARRGSAPQDFASDCTASVCARAGLDYHTKTKIVVAIAAGAPAPHGRAA